MRLNNSQFDGLIEFGLEVAQMSANPEEKSYVDRMKKMTQEKRLDGDYETPFFWPGRGIDITQDFPQVDEQKFWSRVFYDVARAIFDRKIGIQDYDFWQTQRIWQAYGVGYLFETAVRSVEKGWSANSRDSREWNEWHGRK